MAEALIRHLPDKVRLCIATDLTGKDQRIQTCSIADWRRTPPELPARKPALFLFQA